MDAEKPRTPLTRGPAVGVVLGTQDTSPLEFWVGVAAGQILELDALVEVGMELPTSADHPPRVTFWGLVDEVRKRFEGAKFDSDAFKFADATLPIEVAWVAHVQVIRIEPEVFVPPQPGASVFVVRSDAFAKAMGFQDWPSRLPIGLTRTNEPVYANFDFVDGTRGAHVSISGVSGVATKTSYATFLLYGLFHSPALGAEAVNTKAVIFNVKGEDLLWLDRPNVKVTDAVARDYQRLGLPVGAFQSVGLYAPAKAGPGDVVPAVEGRLDKAVRPYLWTLRDFGLKRLLRFSFAGADDPRAQLSLVTHRVEAFLVERAEATPRSVAGLEVDGQTLRSFGALVDWLSFGSRLDTICPGSASGTLDAFRRRLFGARERIGHLIRGDDGALNKSILWLQNQVTVIDIHALHSTAQTFVVGAVLAEILAHKEHEGSRPLVFVVLDELNKYAPRQGWSPIQDVLLDIAERGRSLGLCLFGAQQTASEVERRVVTNAAVKVVGRLDAAESERPEYAFLGRVGRLRAALLRPGSMLVSQPEISTPLLVRFPFPSWATRRSEAGVSSEPRQVSLFEDD